MSEQILELKTQIEAYKAKITIMEQAQQIMMSDHEKQLEQMNYQMNDMRENNLRESNAQ